MAERTNRRTVLGLLGAGALGAVAGCLDEIDLEDGTGDDDGTDDGETGTGRGADDGSVNGAGLVEELEWTNGYRVEGQHFEDDVRWGYVFHGDDVYQYTEAHGSETEMYAVDNDVYIVSDGECTRFEGDDPDEAEGGAGAGTDVDDGDVRRYDVDWMEEVGTDTIEGDEVTVYEVGVPGVDRGGGRR